MFSSLFQVILYTLAQKGTVDNIYLEILRIGKYKGG